MKSVDILIKNANEILTLEGPNKPRIKSEMNNLGIIKGGDIAIENGKIVDIGLNLNYDAESIISKGRTNLSNFARRNDFSRVVVFTKEIVDDLVDIIKERL